MSVQPLPIERHTIAAPGGERKVVTVTIDQPDRKVAVLDRALLDRLNATMDQIGDDAGGLVLTSSSRVFVAGADLQEISGLSDAALDEYLAYGQRVFARFAAIHCTTVAALNGAALGGGLELAMHCDALLGLRPDPAKPYQVGLVEASLAILPGWGGTNMLPARMDPARAIAMTAAGASMPVTEAADAGLIESLHDTRDELLAAARARAALDKDVRDREQGAAGGVAPRTIGQASRRESVRIALSRVRPELPKTGAAKAVAECVDAGLAGGWKAALDAERRHLVRLRSTPEAKAALKAFFERAAGR